MPAGILNVKPMRELRECQRRALRQLAEGGLTVVMGTAVLSGMDLLTLHKRVNGPVAHNGSPVAVYVGGANDPVFWPTEELHPVQLKRRNEIAQRMLRKPPPGGY